MLAQVIKLGPIYTHLDADRLDITYDKKGNPIILGRGEFKEGDLAAYIPVGAMVCTFLPEFEWLGTRRIWHRVKPRKLRGVRSHGIVVPAPPDTKEGDDCTDQLMVLPYIPIPRTRSTRRRPKMSKTPSVSEIIFWCITVILGASVIASMVWGC